MELAQLSNDRKAEHHKSQCDVLLGILFVERNIKFGNIKIYESLARLCNDRDINCVKENSKIRNIQFLQ